MKSQIGGIREQHSSRLANLRSRRYHDLEEPTDGHHRFLRPRLEHQSAWRRVRMDDRRYTFDEIGALSCRIANGLSAPGSPARRRAQCGRATIPSPGPARWALARRHGVDSGQPPQPADENGTSSSTSTARSCSSRSSSRRWSTRCGTSCPRSDAGCASMPSTDAPSLDAWVADQPATDPRCPRLPG